MKKKLNSHIFYIKYSQSTIIITPLYYTTYLKQQPFLWQEIQNKRSNHSRSNETKQTRKCFYNRRQVSSDD